MQYLLVQYQHHLPLSHTALRTPSHDTLCFEMDEGDDTSGGGKGRK